MYPSPLLHASTLLALLGFFLTAHAIPPPCAGPTPITSISQSNGVSPAPTTRPFFKPEPELKRDGLQIRQYVDTCGYINADLNFALTCAAGYQCAQNDYFTAIGCCPDGQLQYCQLQTTCIGYSQWSSNCDVACQNNYAIGKCMDPTYPYCATIRSIFGSSTFQGYNCATQPLTVTIKPTYTNYGAPTGTVQVAIVTETYIPPSSAVGATYVNVNGDGNTVNTGDGSNVKGSSGGGKGGLSTGEIVGIVAGVVGAVAAVVTLWLKCCK